MIVKKVTSKKELDDAFYVRKLVFVKEQQVPMEIEIDEFEQEAIHFVGYLDDTPIAASRLRWVDQFGKLERLCVIKKYRGQQFGTEMIKGMEAEVVEHGYDHTKLHAQTQAIEFYKQLGYEIHSDQFLEAGIPHVVMIKQLTS